MRTGTWLIPRLWPDSAPVVVINETLARQFFFGDPVGKTLVLPKWDPPLHLEVVGVVADVAELGPGVEPPGASEIRNEKMAIGNPEICPYRSRTRKPTLAK